MKLRKLEPEFHERVWGSTALAPWFPLAESAKKIGEVWFQTEEIPLLVKFLFTTENLSVQVHPGDAYAQKHHHSLGKTEMWHVLAAEPGAKIAAGFREPVTHNQVQQAALSGEIESLLEWYSAAPGDTFFIPAGTVHAIGAGLTICEIQQVSDVTYRLYDYGRGRELHLEHGLAVSQFTKSSARAGLPVTSEYFVTSALNASSDLASDHHQLVIAIGGEGHVDELAVRAGEVLFVPVGTRARVSGALQLLATHSPNSVP